ncbi:hypothetical protein J4528_10790 [Neisseria subflava]|nr:hypothetical protein [Neisseria subflava]MCL9792720.1 hypothetical protein [Neisseria subflava]
MTTITVNDGKAKSVVNVMLAATVAHAIIKTAHDNQQTPRPYFSKNLATIAKRHNLFPLLNRIFLSDGRVFKGRLKPDSIVTEPQ